ncbi:MAG: Rrf2 family transcriptional regulator [Bacteroidota bacterium]|nr:Rrf2 family transcriptional regulator [Bacteroidota bacterium]MDP4230763.1 Rrf2 family transcriptional regulator [Bacteroidota bacterium]MDP4236443.1 Rrf2 family transcriptional regulator [Bacteroidota bacterium]
MLRLSKRVEYGLMALQYLAKSGGVATAREISDAGQIPYELLAKVMQSLKHEGIIDSYQGVRGGYALLFSPESINLARVVRALDEHTTITECISPSGDHDACQMLHTCTIKAPMNKLQQRMEESIGSMTIAELL